MYGGILIGGPHHGGTYHFPDCGNLATSTAAIASMTAWPRSRTSGLDVSDENLRQAAGEICRTQPDLDPADVEANIRTVLRGKRHENAQK